MATATRKKKDTTEYLLVDMYGDPVMYDTLDVIVMYLDELVEFREVEKLEGWKVFELGRQLSIDVETKVTVSS